MRSPACAITTARFDASVLLPSPGFVLVIKMVCTGLSIEEYWMFVRSVRSDSAKGDFDWPSEMSDTFRDYLVAQITSHLTWSKVFKLQADHVWEKRLLDAGATTAC